MSADCTICQEVQNYKERVWRTAKDTCIFKWARKKDKSFPVITSETTAVFHTVDNTMLVLKFVSKGKRQIFFFFSVRVHACACSPLHAHVHTMLQKAGFRGTHTCTWYIAVWYGKPYWHEFGVGRLLKGRSFLRSGRYFIRTNVYLKGTSWHQQTVIFQVFLEKYVHFSSTEVFQVFISILIASNSSHVVY